MRRNRRHRYLGLSLPLLLAVSLAACGDGGSGGESEADTSLTFASSTPPNFSAHDTEQWWVEQVEEQSDLDITLHQNSSLLPASETIAGLRDGRAQIGYLPLALVGSNFPLWSVAGLPFLSNDAEAQQSVLTLMYNDNEALRAEFESQGLRVLFFIPLGSGLIGTKQPIETMSDLEGNRVRSFGLVGEAVSALSTEVVPLDTAELYEALERGTIDSVAGPLIDSAVGMGLQEVVPNFTDAGIGLNLSVAIVMSKQAYDGLSDGNRAAIDQVSEDVIAESLVNLSTYEASACEKLLADGGKVGLLSEAAQAEWREMVQDDVTASWRATALESGASEEDVDAVYDEYTSQLAELTGAGSYQDGLRACAEKGA